MHICIWRMVLPLLSSHDLLFHSQWLTVPPASSKFSLLRYIHKLMHSCSAVGFPSVWIAVPLELASGVMFRFKMWTIILLVVVITIFSTLSLGHSGVDACGLMKIILDDTDPSLVLPVCFWLKVQWEQQKLEILQPGWAVETWWYYLILTKVVN